MAHPKVGIRKKDTGWADFFKRVEEIAHAGKVKVGFLDAGPGAEPHGTGGLTVAQVAAVLEFGTEDGRIRARPVLRATFDQKRPELEQMARELTGKILDGKMSAEQATGLLGAKLANDVKKYVTAGPHVQPENAPSTVARKGSDRPWVDTGRTIGSVTWMHEGGSKKHEK